VCFQPWKRQQDRRTPHEAHSARVGHLKIALDFKAAIHNHTVVDSLSTTLSAISDPTRRAILARLSAGSATVGELAEPFRMSQQAVSKHLAYLERARLVQKRREGRRHVCVLKPATFKEVADWVEYYRNFWQQALDRMGEYFRTMEAREEKHGRKRRD
jgi:DNA-binding transcriptional ArsR family regulator